MHIFIKKKHNKNFKENLITYIYLNQFHNGLFLIKQTYKVKSIYEIDSFIKK